MADGETAIAYQTSSVPAGLTCNSQVRVCSKGNLSGSFTFSSCNVGNFQSCSFNGQSIAHGSSINAYLANSVPYGSSCSVQTRTCNNGTLSGTYAYSNCSVGSANSCTFNGQTVAHGANVIAYQTSSVPAGSTCQSQSRVCNNGALSGSYTNASCSVGNYLSCTFNGQSIAHGTSVTAYLASSVAYGATCSSQTRTCNNGVLSGTYGFASCSAGNPASCTFNGQTVPHGNSIIAFLASSVPAGTSCQSQSRVCNNGTLSGTYTFASCAPSNNQSCTLNGQTIPHGTSVTTYLNSSVPAGSTCQSQVRTCNNGSLSGSYTNFTCTVQSAASCSVMTDKTTYSSNEVINFIVSSTGSSMVERNCNSAGWVGLANINGSNQITASTFAPASYTCQYRGTKSADGTKYNCSPSSSSFTVNCAAGTVKLNGTCQSCNSSNAEQWYLEANPDIKSGVQSGAIQSGLAHWCAYGKNEGRQGCFTDSQCNVACPAGTVKLNGTCQSCNSSNAEQWYLAVNPDVKSAVQSGAVQSGLAHWCASGKNEGRQGCFTDSQCPQTKVMSTGMHCDINGPWGWRSDEISCPAGTNPINPSSVGGCPAGWSQYGTIGCYISNTDPRRSAGCMNSNPNDECCAYTCSTSAPAPTWTCLPASECNSQITCTSNFGSVMSKPNPNYTPGNCGGDGGGF